MCKVHLGIGLLFISKGNIDFGWSRILKYVEPYQRKLHGPEVCRSVKLASMVVCDMMALRQESSANRERIYEETAQFYDNLKKYGDAVSRAFITGLEAS